VSLIRDVISDHNSRLLATTMHVVANSQILATTMLSLITDVISDHNNRR
jgi:hypothetical protein